MSTVDEMTSRRTREQEEVRVSASIGLNLPGEEIPVSVGAHALRRLARSYFFSAK
jgi:hypothetical protein